MRLFGKSRSKRPKPPAGPPRRRVLFVSHEATRTGAPKIVLNILKHFKAKCDVQCESLLLTGGHLADEFGQHSIVDCFNLPANNVDDIRKKTTRAVLREKNNTPVLAICNSMESRNVAATLADLKIPCVSLVHELPSSYQVEDYEQIFEASKKVVFPAHTVRDAADIKTTLPLGKSLVLPQGLLDPEFGQRLDKDSARNMIRKELGIPANSFIVLGCGTLDLRKGIDHYAAVARRVCAQNQSDTPIHFVWVGEGPRWTHSIHHYVELDLQKSKACNNVHFIGERPDVESYFLGADVFLMSSRVDPFPCVIHEAMASRIPIITFQQSGGAPEAVDNGAGLIVPYADYEQAAAAINMICREPALMTGMTERAYERVQTRYQFEDYAEKLIDLGESVISQNLRHSSFELKRAA